MAIDLHHLPPGLVLIVCGGLLSFLRLRLRQLTVALLPPLLLVQLCVLEPTAPTHWLGQTLIWLNPSATGLLFAAIFLIALWAGSLFALKDARPCELAAAFIYAGGSIGISLCGDWISLFIFWEIMALASTLIIWNGGQPDSQQAGLRYLLVHLAGGVLLLIGIAGLALSGNHLVFGHLSVQGWPYWLVLAGILVNAGAPPLSFWVADAYPQASASGMVFLSAFTTKTAVFVLITAFDGEQLLIPVGLYMAFYGIVYALLETDVRRILAYSIINQVGFMVTAVGIGTQAALIGATTHAGAHIFYKMVLLMGAGEVLRQTGTSRATHLGALWRTMPWTTACVVIGAAASMGLPFTSSFVTKSLILQGAAEQHLPVVWILLLLCSAAVVFNAGIRFPWLTFFQPTSLNPSPQQDISPERASDIAGLSRLAITAGAALCLLVGWFPQTLYSWLGAHNQYHPYVLPHLIEQMQVLLPATLLFFVSLRWFQPQPALLLDTDWVFRRLLYTLWLWTGHTLKNQVQLIVTISSRSLIRSFQFLFRTHGPRGVLARSWPTGSLALWVAFLLASYVAVYNLKTQTLWKFIQNAF
ncbi:MAG: hypothetical protein JXR59_04985 [Desulfuromonadaceae bacterium]|nr:hypothetical protein [Desulfuromonadaceae bacterium]